MKRSTQIICIAFLGLFSCNSDQETSESTPIISEQTVNEDSIEELPIEEQKEPIQNDSIPSDSLAMDVELPFQYPYESSFKYIGAIKVSESRWEEIQIGKGWDSRRHSCSFIWGEHIYNTFPPDTTITDFRMHLVDLDSAEIELTPEFLNSELFKQHLIVTTTTEVDDLKTFWDPSGTGKYPKPKQWVE